MAITITAGTDQTFNLQRGLGYTERLQRGAYEVVPSDGGNTIQIIRIGEDVDSVLVGKTPLTDINGGAFLTFDALMDYLEPFFFRSLTGGGGDGVQSVTGDGVDNTNPTMPVISFPDADEVDDSATTNKYVTQAEKDQIGTNTTNIDNNTASIGGNTTAINTHVANVLNPHATSVSNLSDSLITTPVINQVLTFNGSLWVNAASQGFDPTASGVLTEYIDSQNNNQASTNSTSLVTYLTLVDTDIDINSDYRFAVSFSISHTATNSNAVVDIKDFGTTILPQVYTVEPKDNSNRTWVSLEGRLTPNPLSGGQIQLQLDFGTDNSNNTTTMYFANISLQKINE